MTPPSSYVASVSFLCLLLLLLPAHHGASPSYGSYKLGSRQHVFFKRPGRSQEASTAVPPAATSSSLTTGLGNNKIPVVHREGPCSPLQGADILRRDASLIQDRLSSELSPVDAEGPSPATTIISANHSSDGIRIPGEPVYSVLVSYGTPEQQFPVTLRTTSNGVSVLRCKLWASDYDDCEPAFDTSGSSTFARILCGSPNCPANNCSGGSYCPLDGIYSDVNGTYAEDVLTLTPSLAIHDFKFLDLSMHRNSLPSQLSSSGIGPTTATFSYCLPRSPKSVGFLSLGGDPKFKSDNYNLTSHAPLVNNIELPSHYFIDVVGMSLGSEDLPVPAGTFSSNGTLLDVESTFTRLTPDAYKLLHDSFRKQMSQYKNLSVPGFDAFNTCYNFTGLQELTIPTVEFKFSNGESIEVDRDQMLYYGVDPDAGPFTTACLAFLSSYARSAVSTRIGTYSLANTEVVYDVAGGMVGFIPGRC